MADPVLLGFSGFAGISERTVGKGKEPRFGESKKSQQILFICYQLFTDLGGQRDDWRAAAVWEKGGEGTDDWKGK